MIQFRAEYFEELTDKKLERLHEVAQGYFSHRERLYGRYLRKENCNSLMRGNKMAMVAFEYYIVNMAQGYLAGKAPVYSVKSGEEFMQKVDWIRLYNDDAATFVELMHDYLICGAAYLYVYENEKNEIVYTRFDCRKSVVIYDYNTPPSPVAMLRTWKESEDEKEIDVFEVITKSYKRVFKNGLIVDDESLAWGDVPIAVFESPDGIAVFEPAIEMIDTFQNIITNVKNMTQYNDSAKLKIVGFRAQNEMMIEDDKGNLIENPARKAEETALYKAKAIYLDEGGDLSWLLKNIDYSGILAVLKQLHDLITMQTGVPNMTDEAFSNADNASALGYKLYALDQYSATADRIFKKGYQRLWEIITNRLNLKGASFDFRQIEIAFNRNIPTDIDKSIQRAVNAKNAGLVSTETAINISDIEVDAKSEMQKIKQELEEDYNNLQTRVEDEAISNERAK